MSGENKQKVKQIGKQKEKQKEKKEHKKSQQLPSGRKRKVRIAGGILVIALAAGGSGIYIMWRQDRAGEDASGQFAVTGSMGTGIEGSNVITATGTTSMGVTREDFEVEELDTKLKIEEVYVSNNSEIEKGTAILRISENSIAEARKELEKAAKEAELAYRAGAIEYEQSRITAKCDYDSAVLQGNQAKAVYEQSLSQLSGNIDKAQEALEEANEMIAGYEEAIAGDTYKTEYPYEQLKALYDENLALLTGKLSEWGVTWEQVTGGGMKGGNQNATVLANLYSILEQNLKDYEEAEKNYKNATEDAGIQLQKLKLNLSTLQSDLLKAREEKEEKEIQAKLAYETALAKAEQAQKDYETALQKAEATCDDLADASEDADKNLKAFEDSIGDGTYYAGSGGTVIMMPYRAESYLEPDSMVLAYSNKEEVTVAVYVDQSDIASVNVGDSCMVQFNEYGMFQGTVTSVDPVSSSGSKTSVTYTVSVELKGDVSSLSSNLTATVLFGMGGIAQ